MPYVVVTLKVEERDGRRCATLWYGGRKIRKRTVVRIDIGKDGSVSESSVKKLRSVLESSPVGYIRRNEGGHAIYYVAEGDEYVKRAVEEAVNKGSSKFRAKVKMLRVSWEERLLSRELWRRRIKHMTNINFEGYNVDILLRDCKIIVEVDGLQHYQERIQEKDMKKLELLKSKGYEVFRIQASDIRRDPDSIADMIRDAFIRRLRV